MKSPTRRLGRGLGAFLDLRPVGEDGAAFVSDSRTAETASILDASVAPPEPSPPAPVPRAAKPIAPTPPPVAADECGFIDDLVAPLTFPDVELE